MYCHSDLTLLYMFEVQTYFLFVCFSLGFTSHQHRIGDMATFSFTGGGTPWVPFRALFQTRKGHLNRTTDVTYASWIGSLRERV
jgi:hypothetical protein